MRREIGAAIVALALVVGCAGPGPLGRVRVNEEERRAYSAARSQIETDLASAERAFEDFLGTWPNSPLAPQAEMQLARIAHERGDSDEALRRYDGVLLHYPDIDVSDVARVRVAEIKLARAEPEAAAQVLAQVRTSRLSKHDVGVAFRILATVAPDPVAKLRWLARLRAIEPEGDAAAAIDVEIDGWIAQLDAPNVERAIDQIGPNIPAARLQLRRASLALEAGDLELAEAAWRQANALPQAPGTEREQKLIGDRIELRLTGRGGVLGLPSFAEAMRLEPPVTDGARGTLGVVLPLSGPFSHFGEESLNGILLAAGVFGEPVEGRNAANVRLVVRDSAGRPERAAEAVRELAADPSIAAIIGPMIKGESEAAAAAAELARIPLIALTARSEIAEGRSHVFRVRTQPEQEIQVLVDYAMGTLGAQRFAILYPRDAYGRGLRGLFWDAVEDRGGSIVSVASYDPGITDFAEPIRRLVGYELLRPDQKAAIQEREESRRRAQRMPPEEALVLREEAIASTTRDGEPLPPIVDYDALFIPESHDEVVLIAPQLAFHEAVGAQLLGTSGWYHPDLVEIGRNHLRGALFTAQFYADSPMPFVRDFTERYETAFAAEPDALAAQAFDAANLGIIQLARGRDSREALRTGILAIRAYPGVSGVLRMGPDGNASKRPYLLEVEDGRLTQVE